MKPRSAQRFALATFVVTTVSAVVLGLVSPANADPSPGPSTTPTVQPSDGPSTTPTTAPSDPTPTAQPSSAPSTYPASPTDSPSDTASPWPSWTPSASPQLTDPGSPTPSTSPTDPQTGSITGEFLANGEPIYASVTLYDSHFGYVGFGESSAWGGFSFTGLAPGTYELTFGFSGGTQWYHQQVDQDSATPVVVVAGQATRVEEERLPTGTIAGTLTDSSGAPVAYASVNASGVTGGSGSAVTDSTGHYQIDLLPGTYTVAFYPPNSSGEYAHHALSQQTAATFVVTGGSSTTVDEQLPATGTISGRYTAADGSPISGENVQILTPDGTGYAGFTTTDSDGRYTVANVYEGTYVVQFMAPDWSNSQYAHGKLTAETADRITVVGGQNTVVNDSAIPTGSIRITAKDSVTGAAVQSFCGYVDGVSACTTTGTLALDGVRQGQQSVQVTVNDGHYFNPGPVQVTVSAAATVTASVTLKPGATITVLVRDHATGQPVANACGTVVPTNVAMLPDGFGYCSDQQGILHMGPLQPGSYNLFVGGDGESGYGLQWVGPHGGVGAQALAEVVSVKDTSTVTGPDVLLDPQGTVTGTLTNPAGQPVYGMIGLTPFAPGPGPAGPTGFSDRDGHYTLSGLGPYAWPLYVYSSGAPSQYWGGRPSADGARTVQVVAKDTATADIALVGGVTVSGIVRDANGQTITAGRVIAYDPKTWSVVAADEVDASGQYQLLVLPGQQVKFQFEYYAGTYRVAWFGGSDYASATKVAIHNGAVQNLVFT